MLWELGCRDNSISGTLQATYQTGERVWILLMMTLNEWISVYTQVWIGVGFDLYIFRSGEVWKTESIVWKGIYMI